MEELRCALEDFGKRYNQRWIVQRLGYITPAQARQQLFAPGGAAGINLTRNPTQK